MRLLFVSIRYGLIASFLFLISCGGNSVHISGRSPSPVSISGKITVEGSNPFSRRVSLIDDYGIKRVVKNPGMEDELAVLDGHSVVVEGYISGGPKRGYTIHADTYGLRAEVGMSVFKGVVAVQGDELVVRSSEGGARCAVEGELAEALRSYRKCLVWVWGQELQAGAETAEGKLFGIYLRGYAVLGFGE